MDTWWTTVADLSPAGILAAVIFAIVLGKLIPASRADREIEIMERRLADKDAALEAGAVREDTQRETIKEQNAQITELIRTALTTEKVLLALPKPGEQPAGAGEHAHA